MDPWLKTKSTNDLMSMLDYIDKYYATYINNKKDDQQHSWSEVSATTLDFNNKNKFNSCFLIDSNDTVESILKSTSGLRIGAMEKDAYGAYDDDDDDIPDLVAS
jgi:hypothetical protein